MKFLIFFYFCESFLPSWIRIPDPDSESEIRIRIRNPNLESESAFRIRILNPEYESEIQNPNPESRIRNPNPESDSGSRSTDLIEFGSKTLPFFGWNNYFSKKNFNSAFKKSEDLTQKNPNCV
jgi:hypothetical protein